MNERTTRKQLIDRALTAAGWRVVSYARWRRGEPRPPMRSKSSPPTAAPAISALPGWQARRRRRGRKAHRRPAERHRAGQRYARTLADSPFRFGEFRLPFVYATNGELIYFCDLRDTFCATRQVRCFHTPDALRETLSSDLGSADLWAANSSHRRPRPLLPAGRHRRD